MWGTAFVFIRAAVETVPPLSVAAGRIVAAATVLLIAVRLSGLRFPRGLHRWAWFALLASVGNALPFFLISWGQQRVESGLTGILMAVNPLVTLSLAHWFVPDDRVTARRALGFILGLCGIGVLLGPEAWRGLGGGTSDLVHRLAILGGALCYATNSVLTRRMPETHPLVASAAVLGVGTFLIVPPAILLGAPLGAEPASTSSLLSVLWLGMIPTAAATIVYFRVIASAGPTFQSLVNYLVPPVAVLTGAAAYGEQPGVTALLALGLILTGLTLGQPKASRAGA